MLDGLDDVPWDRLQHAYGPAADVPGLLRDLAIGDDRTRQSAWRSLYGNLWHQGTIYEASAYAIPFLIELAGHPGTADRHEVLVYIGDLATGNSYWEVHRHTTILVETTRKPGFADTLARERGWVAATRQAAAKGMMTYRTLLGEPEPAVSAAAARLLGILRDDPVANFDHLQARFDLPRSGDLERAACCFAIGLLSAAFSPALEWTVRHAVASEAPAVAVLAALALAQSAPEKATVGTRALLASTIEAPRPAESVINQFPWDKGEVGEDCAAALARIEAISADTPVDRIAALDRRPDLSMAAAEAMLEAAFGGKPMPVGRPARELTETQFEALRAIALSERYWRREENRVHYLGASDLLRRFGLPDSAAELEAYLLRR